MIFIIVDSKGVIYPAAGYYMTRVYAQAFAERLNDEMCGGHEMFDVVELTARIEQLAKTGQN
jgi:hypothetical protein